MIKKFLSVFAASLLMLSSTFVYADSINEGKKSFGEVLGDDMVVTAGVSDDTVSSSAVEVIEEERPYTVFDRSNTTPPPKLEEYVLSVENGEKSELFADYYEYEISAKMTPHWNEDKDCISVDLDLENKTEGEVNYVLVASFFDNEGNFRNYAWSGYYLQPKEAMNYTVDFEDKNKVLLPDNVKSSVTLMLLKSETRDYLSNDDERKYYNFDAISPLAPPIFLDVDYNRNITVKSNSIEEDTQATTKAENPYGNDDYVKTFKTNYNESDYIEFTADGASLSAHGVMADSNYNYLYFTLNPVGERLALNADNVFSKAADGSFSSTYDASSLDDDMYDMYFLRSSDNRSYSLYISGITVVKDNGELYIVIPNDVYTNNKNIRKKTDDAYSTEYWLGDYYYISKDPDDEAEIKSAAEEITADCPTTYEKILALHDYIASNVYYDYDFFEGRESTSNFRDIDVLHHKYAVCQGYATLFISMARKLGIPARMAVGWSNPDNLSWAERLEQQKVSDHAWAEFYDGTRWIVADVTWDSSLERVNGDLSGDPTKVNHRYFDITDELFSVDHKTENYE